MTGDPLCLLPVHNCSACRDAGCIWNIAKGSQARQELNAEIRLTADSNNPKVKRHNQALGETRNVVDSFINSQFEAEHLGMGDDMLFWSDGAPEMAAGDAVAATNRAAIQKWRKA